MAEISDEEYVRRFGELYNTVMSLRRDEDYRINEEQMRKFFEVCEFFGKSAESDDEAYINPIKLTPREEHGGLTATFLVFDMWGECLEEFKKIVQHLSALTIDATTDYKVCISVTVPNVFVPKFQ